MKKLALILGFSLSLISFSQNTSSDFNTMVESEMKSAASIVDFQINPNTQNYNITYHKLEFTVDPAVYFISGKVTTTFTALTDMNTVTFDLASALTVSSVKQGTTNLTFVQNTNNELIITLPTTQVAGNSATVEIIYSGAPPISGFQAFATETHNGTPVLWTLSEPFGARDWWPCKQDLNDKINSIDVYITAPSQYTSASNGVQQSAVVNGSSKTTHFHHNYPIPAYLIAIAVTNYQIYNQQAGLGTTSSPFFPIVNYIYPENATSTQSSLAVTPPIMNFFESILGPYPFRNEKYGHAQFGWGGGMEHTTVSFMGGWSRSLIAHEMGHQWFGNKVTCGTWKDIWLNEGITEYMSGLVVENFDGAANFVNWKTGKINNITSLPNGNLYLTDAQALNVNRIFSSRLSYNKGAMVTNMLRFKLGNTAFYQALQNYLNDPQLAYSYALTPQFQNHLESTSGIDLDEFFNDWVYMEGYPIYSITAYNSSPGQATVTINQTTSDSSVPFFEMPVPIRFLGSAGQTHDVVLDNTMNGQLFTVSVPFTVTDVQFDPDKNIISKNSTATLSSESFELTQQITVYPNPADQNIYINLPGTIGLEKVEIYNALGQLIVTESQKNITVSGLSNGMHLLKIHTSEGITHKKFIKK